MTSKNCTQCKELKPLSEFYKFANSNDGHAPICKKCARENHALYCRTKHGVLARIYMGQRSSSRRRGHKMPEYDLKEFREWSLSQDKFNALYNLWVASNYDTMLSPSADRIDDYKTYFLGGLQWMTWDENRLKGFSDRKNGINNKLNKAIVQMNLNGTFVDEHYSQHGASRKTLISNTAINGCCNGHTKTSGGYRWMFSLGIKIYNNSFEANALKKLAAQISD